MATVHAPHKKHIEEKIEKAQSYSEIIMGCAAGLGYIACFMPALSMEFLGSSISAKVVDDWRGKLDFVGYIAVGVMAFQMMKAKGMASHKKMMACLIISGVVALLAIWLPMTLSGMGVSKGIGLWINILASLGLLAGAALKAKSAKMF